MQCEQVDQLPVNGCLKLKKQLSPAAVGLFAPQACQLKSTLRMETAYASLSHSKKRVADQRSPQPVRPLQLSWIPHSVTPADLLFHQPHPRLQCRHTSLSHNATVTPFPVETCWFYSATQPANSWNSPDVPYTSFFPVIYRVKIAGAVFLCWKKQ